MYLPKKYNFVQYFFFVKFNFYIIATIALSIIMISCNGDNTAVSYKDKAKDLLYGKYVNNKGKYKDLYLDTIYKYLLKSKNDSISRNLLFKVSTGYYDLGKIEKYLSTSNKIYDLALQDKDTLHMGKALYYIGEYYDDNENTDSAYYYYSKSSNYFKLINDTLHMGQTGLYKAGILYDIGNYNECEIEAISALRLLIDTKNTRLKYECYTIIALSLDEQNNYKKSLEYYNLALNQLLELDKENYPRQKILNSRASSYNNIGGVLEKSEKFKDAIKLYHKGLRTPNLKRERPQLYAMLLNNLGSAEMKVGNLRTANELLFKALYIRDSLKLESGIVSSKIRIGEYYILQNDTLKALSYLKQGYFLAKKIKSTYDILYSLELIVKYDKQNQKFFSDTYIGVNDSIRMTEKAVKNKFARIAYETDKIEVENRVLTKRYNNVILVSLATIILIIGLFIIYRLKVRNKELVHVSEQQYAKEQIYNLLLTHQSKAQEARKIERNRIARDLHDGIVNRIFTARFNLMQLESEEIQSKEKLINELSLAEEEIRIISHNLKQSSIVESGYTSILTELVTTQKNEHNTIFDLHIDNFIEWELYNNEVMINIYRIIQELINNVNKYAFATHCNVALFKTANSITLRFWDNGLGFNIQGVKEGIGFQNISERTKYMGGTLKINSERNMGTHIEIVIPNI